MVVWQPQNMECRQQHLVLLCLCPELPAALLSHLRLQASAQARCGQRVTPGHSAHLWVRTEVEGRAAVQASCGKSPPRCCACSSVLSRRLARGH